MPKYQYQISGASSWMSSSGNALLAFFNYTGSLKKINIHSIEVYNNTRLGATLVGNTNNPSPMKLKIGPVTGLAGGDVLTPQKHDTNASNWPSTVTVTENSGYVPFLIRRGSVLAATATAGTATFTPTAVPTPAWTTNEHRQANRYFVVTGGGNGGTYRVLSNTNTALTLTNNFAVTASTEGYIADSMMHCWLPITKMLSTSTTGTLATTNFGMFANRNFTSGDIFRASTNSAIQKITVRPNEQLAVFADFPTSSFPVLVSATLIRNGSPNYTYTVSYYTYLNGEYTSLFAINNAAGSGETIQIESITVSELGTLDTPYFQVVPISKINSTTLNDSTRKLTSTAFAMDSASPTLSSSICDIFTDAAVTATGIPISYIAEGSANAIPKGFNYLNTKDFVGPMYMAFFPEAAGFKIVDGTFWTSSTPGTFGSQISQEWSTIKGRNAPIVIREGEGFAIVSGAETAAGGTINIVGTSAWEGLEFAITFSVENATTPSLVLTSLQSGSEILIIDHTSGATLASEESNVSGTFTYSYDYSAGTFVDIIVHSLGYEYYRLNNIELTSGGVSIPISQRVDRNYSNP